MTKVSMLMRKLFRKDGNDDCGLQLRLRKAVILSKSRQVLALLEAGASPIWIERDLHSSRRSRRRGWDSFQLNALLLACCHGDVEILSLLLDALIDQPQVVAHLSRAMYCLVIRHNHWKAFMQLQERHVPMSSASSRSSTYSASSPISVAFTQPLSAAAMEHSSSKLPMPIFVAAEHGRHHILGYMLDHFMHDWAHYTFEEHSLLSVATINGHYTCVKILLEREVATRQILVAAVATARRHRQAHVLVLLTSYLPKFEFEPNLNYIYFGESLPSNVGNGMNCKQLKWPSQDLRIGDRGSIAETVTSDLDDESRRSSLLTAGSPVHFNEDMNRVEEMHTQAEREREQRQIDMLWFLHGREPSARDNAPKFNNSCTFSNEKDEAWYAVKFSDKYRKQHDDLLAHDKIEFDSSYESVSSVHENEESNNELPSLFEETHDSIAEPQSSSLVRSGGSHKLLCVRSHGFRHKLLPAIEEHPAGVIEM